MKIVGAIPNNILQRMPQSDRDALSRRGVTYEEAQIKLAAREEKVLQKHIAALLSQYDILANRSRMDRKKTDMVGWPDFVFGISIREHYGIRNLPVAWECKRPGEKLDEDQIKVRDKMTDPPNGWRYYVIHSVAEAVAVLRDLDVIK